jgi:ParB-like chromosome segregation protein Spo0J
MVDVKRLTPAPWNPRVITEERFDNLKLAIGADPEFLSLRPILASASGIVYAGNMRLRAAVALGMRAVPAIMTEVSDRVAKERAVRDNEQWGAWQGDELASLVTALKMDDVDVSLLGLDEKELRSLLEQTGGNGDTEFPEIDPDKMALEVECPQCHFQFTPGQK